MTPVVREDYKRALAAARKDYEALVQERKTIDARLLETRDVILSLSKLCEGEAEQVVLPSTDQYVSDSRLQKLSIYGLTDAVRIVLQTHIGAMDAKRIRNRLLVFRYDLSKYSNPMAALHGVLVRLASAGEVFMEKIEDKTTYRWIGVGETIKNFSDLALEEEQKRRK